MACETKDQKQGKKGQTYYMSIFGSTARSISDQRASGPVAKDFTTR